MTLAYPMYFSLLNSNLLLEFKNFQIYKTYLNFKCGGIPLFGLVNCPSS